MSALRLFSSGTPEQPGDARTQYREGLLALRAGQAVDWHVDPGNLGMLSRAASEALPEAQLTVVLAAVDEAPNRTIVADEGALVPTLRRLCEKLPLGLRLCMSNGRPLVLPPPALDLSTNDLCGLGCAMCDNRATQRDPKAMTPDEIRALIDEAAGWGIGRVALTGAGEPFRDPEMAFYIRHANARGLLATVTTNGFPVSEALAEELASLSVSVSVSIHGASEATHEALVGVPKAGEHAFRAVRRLVLARDALRGRSKLRVGISMVLQRANLDEVMELVCKAEALGCDGVNLQPVNLQHGILDGDRIVRRDDVLRRSALFPEPSQRKAIERVVAALLEHKSRKEGFIRSSEERLRLLPQYFADASREALQGSCRVGETFLGISHRGAIKPCYRVPWALGDARRVSPRALWNSRAYAETRAQIARCPLTCLNNCFFRTERRT